MAPISAATADRSPPESETSQPIAWSSDHLPAPLKASPIATVERTRTYSTRRCRSTDPCRRAPYELRPGMSTRSERLPRARAIRARAGAARELAAPAATAICLPEQGRATPSCPRFLHALTAEPSEKLLRTVSGDQQTTTTWMRNTRLPLTPSIGTQFRLRATMFDLGGGVCRRVAGDSWRRSGASLPAGPSRAVPTRVDSTGDPDAFTTHRPTQTARTACQGSVGTRTWPVPRWRGECAVVPRHLREDGLQLIGAHAAAYASSLTSPRVPCRLERAAREWRRAPP